MDGSLVSLSGLLVGNQVFDIPVYQRNYAWESKNLEDLWEDLYYLDSSKKHYFGTVLLKDSGNTAETALATLKRFDVIDGQQRMTTVLILLREIISQLREVSEENLRGDVADLEKNYLKNGAHYKLNPLGTDGEFFHHVVIDENEFLSDSTETQSQRRLANAMSFFREKLTEEKSLRASEYQGFLVQLKRKIDELQLIQYQVNSDADAIRIFETVNDRGRPLSNLEKTKSFLMHTSYLGIEDDDAVAGRLEELNGHFSRMYRHFEDVSETRHLERLRLTEDDVQRYHFINHIEPGEAANRPLDSLKTRIREMLIKDPTTCVDYSLEYAKDLEQSFYAVRRIADAYDQDVEGGILSKIFMLERMGNVFPLLIASWLRFGEVAARMEEILKQLEAFIFRVYLIGGLRSDSGESRFNRAAHQVHRGNWDHGALIDELKRMNRHYQNDERFERSLKTEDAYNDLGSRTLRYLLSEYEIYLRKQSDMPLAFSSQEQILTSEYGVEHIWAQNPSEEIPDEMALQRQENLERLGNLTIASKSWNSSMGNKSFKEKRWQPGDKPSYANSSLLVQKQLAEHYTWTTDKIGQRESEIVAFAVARWKV